MHTQVKEQIIIDAPASKIWHILAHDFDKVGLWSSGITKSMALEEIPILDGAVVGGRVCLSDGIGGDVEEEFTYYDEQNMRFGYKAIGDLPSFFKEAENNWQVRSVEQNKSLVAFRAEIDMTLFPGVFLLPLKPIMRRIWGTRTLEELKYYAENDRPHPRKLAAQKNLAK